VGYQFQKEKASLNKRLFLLKPPAIAFLDKAYKKVYPVYYI